jgi:hypothetical protein
MRNALFFIAILLYANGLVAPKGFGAASNKTVDVANFGAVPDDNKDDTRAVKLALHACNEQNAATLVFAKGRYDFYPTFASERYCFVSNNDEGLKRIAFPILNVQTLTIDGQGSEFMFHGFM